MARVGLFGGAFDPPHRAHQALARAALHELSLDVLHIVPTGSAWHKSRPLSSAPHRLAMCQLAFGGLPHTQIDAREMERAGPSYTVDTVEQLSVQYPGAQIFLLLGADQWRAFKRWVRWAEVLKRATLVVADRPVDGGASALPAPDDPCPVPCERLHMASAPLSSTAVRRAVALSAGHGGTLEGWVSPEIASYISRHHLYQHSS